MKKIDLKILCASVFSVMLLFSSCSSEPELPEMADNRDPEISVLALPDFYRLLFAYADRYEQLSVPYDKNGEDALKISFAATYSRYLADGQFANYDFYSPVFQSWRTAVNLQSADRNAASLSSLGIEDLSALIKESETIGECIPITARAVNQNTGSYYSEIMEALKEQFGTGFYNQNEMIMLMAVIQTLGGNVNELFTYNDHANSVSSVIDALLAYRDGNYNPSQPLPYAGCFTMHDAMDYIYKAHPSDEIALSVLDIFYPVLFAMNDYQRSVFVPGLAEYCNSNPIIYETLPRDAMENILDCLSIAAASLNFWSGDNEDAPKFLRVEQDQFEFDTWQSVEFDIEIISNTDWEIVRQTGFTAGKYSGSGNDSVKIKLDSAPGPIGGPPAYGDSYKNIINIIYSPETGKTETVPVTITRYVYPYPVVSVKYNNNIPYRSNQLEVMVSANCDWAFDSTSMWISRPENPSIGYYTGNGTRNLSISGNGPNERSGFFTIRYKYRADTVWQSTMFPVIQEGSNGIAVYVNHLNMQISEIGRDFYYGSDQFTFNWNVLGNAVTAASIRDGLQNAFSNAGVGVTVSAVLTGSNPAENNKTFSYGTFSITASGNPSGQLVQVASLATVNNGSPYLNLYFGVNKP